MTLVVAVRTQDGGTWLGADRIAGGFDYGEIATSKIARLTGDGRDGYDFAVGFAGSPRVAQSIVATSPPARMVGDRPLEVWLTAYADAVYDRLAERGLLADPRNGAEAHLAGDSDFLLTTEGRVFLFHCYLGWEEPARGYVSTGGARETFNGAFEVLRERVGAVTAARRAWPFVQRHHRIGDPADEIFMSGA